MRPIDSENLIKKLQRSHMDVGGLQINLQRTTRVPEGQINSLPAGLGSFPVFKVSDFKSGCPKEWNEEGYFFPMYRQEAMWISLPRDINNPKALIVGAGNINAVTGKPFDPRKSLYDAKGKKKKRKPRIKETKLDIKLEEKQNYLVVPPQPWLDGWKAEDGKIYQFVAAEMGSGETVEGQITGEETVGGIQFIVFDAMKDLIPKSTPREYISSGGYGYSGGWLGGAVYSCFAQSKGISSRSVSASTRRYRGNVQSMGLGKGGEIRQKIYPDPYGLDVWKKEPTAVEVFYMVSSEDFKQVTGHEAPSTPVPYKEYQQKQMPWFDLHDENLKDTKGNKLFDKLKPVGEGKAKKK